MKIKLKKVKNLKSKPVFLSFCSFHFFLSWDIYSNLKALISNDSASGLTVAQLCTEQAQKSNEHVSVRRAEKGKVPPLYSRNTFMVYYPLIRKHISHTHSDTRTHTSTRKTPKCHILSTIMFFPAFFYRCVLNIKL